MYGDLNREMLRVRREQQYTISAKLLVELIFVADELSAVVQSTALLVNSSSLGHSSINTAHVRSEICKCILESFASDVITCPGSPLACGCPIAV